MRHLLLSAVALVLAATGLFGAERKESTVGGKTRDQWLHEIKERDPGVAAKAMQAVAQFGPDIDKEAGPLLIARLGDKDISVKVNAALAIGEIGLAPADVAAGVAGLRRMLGDTQAIVRFHAAIALGRLKAEARPAVPELLYTIRDTSCWEIRKAAAYALANATAVRGQPGDPRVIQALVVALADHSSKVRLEAILGLMMVGTPPTPADRQAEFNALTAVLADRDKVVTIWAHMALMRMDKNFEPHLAAIAKLLATSPDASVRSSAAMALGQAGPEARGYISELIKALEEREPDVVNAATSALVQLKEAVTTGQLNSLVKLLDDSDPQVRCNAARVLGMLGSKARTSIPELVQLLQDREPAVVITAAAALGEMGGVADAALPALNKLADHKSEAVRMTADEAIRKISKR